MAVLHHLYHTKEPPKIAEHLTAELKNFLSCCLKIEPKERWNVYQLLRHPFITGTGDFVFSSSPNSNTSPLTNNEENKYCSGNEERNSKLFDTIKFASKNPLLIKKNTTDKNDIVNPEHIIPIIIKHNSQLSPIGKINL